MARSWLCVAITLNYNFVYCPSAEYVHGNLKLFVPNGHDFCWYAACNQKPSARRASKTTMMLTTNNSMFQKLQYETAQVCNKVLLNVVVHLLVMIGSFQR